MFLFNRNNGYDNIDIQSYENDYSTGNVDHVLVDVRTKGEYLQGHLPKAINIPLNELSQRVNEIPQGKAVVVVCASGNRSRTGASKIVEAGYENVYNLKGGTMTWMMNGKPIVR